MFVVAKKNIKLILSRVVAQGSIGIDEEFYSTIQRNCIAVIAANNDWWLRGDGDMVDDGRWKVGWWPCGYNGIPWMWCTSNKRRSRLIPTDPYWFPLIVWFAHCFPSWNMQNLHFRDRKSGGRPRSSVQMIVYTSTRLSLGDSIQIQSFHFRSLAHTVGRWVARSIARWLNRSLACLISRSLDRSVATWSLVHAHARSHVRSLAHSLARNSLAWSLSCEVGRSVVWSLDISVPVGPFWSLLIPVLP